MKALVLVVLAATLVAACAVTPTPSPATPAPSASPSSVAVAPSPSNSPSPSQLAPAAIECPQAKVKTVFTGTLVCDEAIAAALAALPQGHTQVLKAAFTYRLPCPPSMRCAFSARLDAGFVIITSTVGGLELVRVVKADNGTISTTGPQVYSPPA